MRLNRKSPRGSQLEVRAISELKVLQAVRLKGRVSSDVVAATVDEEPTVVATIIGQLTESGLLDASRTLRLTADGRNRLAELLAEERRGLDTAAVTAAYDDFRSVNADFKALVCDWQLRNGEPNLHDDADYDAGVLSRVDDIHLRVMPIIDTVARQLPRLASYSAKLDGALQKIRAGETAWLTRPIVDSYHTVWFELHEELILAAGLTREAEAKAGHAQ